MKMGDELISSAKISIIVPVYNAEKYLYECVDSLLNQTYKNLEILLINDGSQDGSGGICDGYAEQDKRVCVYHNQNQGVSYTRNFGIAHATGDYLVFVDSDDLVEDVYIEKLYEAVPKDTEDAISICNIAKWDGKLRITLEETLDDFERKKDSLFEKYLKELIVGHVMGSSARIMYPMNLIRKNRIQFHDCKIEEDVLFFIQVLSTCEKVSVCREPLYIYRYHNDSSSHRGYITNYIEDRTKYITLLERELQECNLAKEEYEFLKSFAWQRSRLLLFINAALSPNRKQEIQKLLVSPFSRLGISRSQEREFCSYLTRKHFIMEILRKYHLYLVMKWLRKIKQRK